MSVGRTLVEMTLGQLTAISLQPLDSVETRAHFLSLMGKYFKLLAVQEDPLCVWNLWEQRVTTVRVNILTCHQSEIYGMTVSFFPKVAFIKCSKRWSRYFPTEQKKACMYLE